jgi:hypothetical protein
VRKGRRKSYRKETSNITTSPAKDSSTEISTVKITGDRNIIQTVVIKIILETETNAAEIPILTEIERNSLILMIQAISVTRLKYQKTMSNDNQTPLSVTVLYKQNRRKGVLLI